MIFESRIIFITLLSSLHVNKPWGFGDLNYIDEKFLSMEKFTSK